MIEDGIVTLACGRNIGFARHGDLDGRSKKATTLSRSIMPAPFLPLASRKKLEKL